MSYLVEEILRRVRGVVSTFKNVFNESRNSESHLPYARYVITFLF